jgi:uncharacterized protein (UPF0276 family)
MEDSMKKPLFPHLGIGVGLRPNHYNVFLDNRPSSVSWVEVISENFMSWQAGGKPARAVQTLERIRRDYPVVLHGVSLNIGSTDALNRPYLKRLKTLIDCVSPALVSDHLCWTGVDGENTHDLLPVPYTEESLALIVRKIRQIQDILGRRILLENPSSYLSFSFSEMTEWQFLAEVARQADCGLLLDVNNVYVSSVNHGFDPMTYLKALPKDRVGQIHLAGHSREGRYLIDTHSTPVCQEVWALYEWTVHHLGRLNAMIERDENIPEWSELEREIQIIRSIQNGARAESTQSLAAAI